jgi:hypothetical protein
MPPKQPKKTYKTLDTPYSTLQRQRAQEDVEGLNFGTHSTSDLIEKENGSTFEYATYTPKTFRGKRRPNPNKFWGGRFTLFELFLFVSLVIAHIVAAILVPVGHQVIIPSIVQRIVQQRLDDPSSSNLKVNRLQVFPFQNNEIQVAFGAELPPQIPFQIPGRIDLGQIRVATSIPQPDGDKQIASVLIDPISIALSGPLVVETTVRITFSDEEQQNAVQTLQSLFQDNSQLKLNMVVPVTIAGIPVYSGMPLALTVVLSRFSNGNPLALLGPSDPNQNRASALRQNFQASDIFELTPNFGVVWDSLNMNFNDQGLSMDIGLNIENQGAALLSEPLAISGYVGLVDQRMLKFNLEGVALQQGLQKLNIRLGVSFFDQNIDNQAASAAARQIVQTMMNGGLSDLRQLKPVLQGPFALSNATFLQNISPNLVIPVPIPAQAGGLLDTIRQEITDTRIGNIVDASQFDITLARGSIRADYNVVVPLQLPTPREIILPLNTLFSISDPFNNNILLNGILQPMRIVRNENSFVASGRLNLNPTGTINSVFSLSRNLLSILSTQTFRTRLRNLGIGGSDARPFQFLQQIPIPPFLDNTINLCDVCAARKLVNKVAQNIAMKAVPGGPSIFDDVPPPGGPIVIPGSPSPTPVPTISTTLPTVSQTESVPVSTQTRNVGTLGGILSAVQDSPLGEILNNTKSVVDRVFS